MHYFNSHYFQTLGTDYITLTALLVMLRSYHATYPLTNATRHVGAYVLIVGILLEIVNYYLLVHELRTWFTISLVLLHLCVGEKFLIIPNLVLFVNGNLFMWMQNRIAIPLHRTAIYAGVSMQIEYCYALSFYSEQDVGQFISAFVFFAFIMVSY